MGNTFRRDKLQRLVEAGRVVKTASYHYDDMMRDRALPGTAEPEKWSPYKLWCGDKWECEGCGATILSGFGREPISEHYKPDFADVRERLGAEFQVNDC